MSDLVAATFVARPNRFAVTARLSTGTRVTAHLADPGRLSELLVPGASLKLRPVPASRVRKTRFTAALVRTAGRTPVWVSVDSTLPNRLAERLLARGRVHGIRRGAEIRREVTRGRSRFDFLVRSSTRGETLVEVKSVTLVVEGCARFPDAPTVRGTRHVQELSEVARQGGGAMILFVVQRDDARVVRPNPATDPAFSEALAEARSAGVLLRAARFRMDARGRATWLGPLPVRCG